jgi:hypothetical protein
VSGSGAGGPSTSATSLTYTGDQANAGTYSVTAHYAGDANHFGSDGDPVAIVIKAPIVTTATGGTFAYDGQAHAGPGSANVPGGVVRLHDDGINGTVYSSATAPPTPALTRCPGCATTGRSVRPVVRSPG